MDSSETESQSIHSPSRPPTEKPSRLSSRTLLLSENKHNDTTSDSPDTDLIASEVTKIEVSDMSIATDTQSEVAIEVGGDVVCLKEPADNCSNPTAEGSASIEQSDAQLDDIPHATDESQTVKDGAVIRECEESVQAETPLTSSPTDDTDDTAAVATTHVEVVAATSYIPQLPPTFKPNKENMDLYIACDQGDHDTVRSLLQKGADPQGYIDQSSRRSALHVACEKGWVEVVYLIMEHKPKPDVDFVMSPTGETSLFLAVRGGHSEVVKVLIKFKCDINAVNSYGNSALMEAVAVGNGAMVKLLLNKGAEVNWGNHKGMTALHIIGYLDTLPADTCLEIAEILVLAGADVTRVDFVGYTPLLVCCSTGRMEFIDLLLCNGADRNVVALDGKNGFEVAMEYRHPEVAERFFRHMKPKPAAVE